MHHVKATKIIQHSGVKTWLYYTTRSEENVHEPQLTLPEVGEEILDVPVDNEVPFTLSTDTSHFSPPSLAELVVVRAHFPLIDLAIHYAPPAHARPHPPPPPSCYSKSVHGCL